MAVADVTEASLTAPWAGCEGTEASTTRKDCVEVTLKPPSLKAIILKRRVAPAAAVPGNSVTVKVLRVGYSLTSAACTSE